MQDLPEKLQSAHIVCKNISIQQLHRRIFLHLKIASCHISIRDYQASVGSTSGNFGANSGKNRIAASTSKTALFFGQFWLGNFAMSGLAICFYLEAAQEKIRRRGL